MTPSGCTHSKPGLTHSSPPQFCKELGRYTDLRAAVLVGGDSMEEQFGALAQNPDILVATPGRLMHHLSEVEGMSLRSVEYVVFDEADRLFEMGFAEQLRSILHHLADSRQVRLRAGLRERFHMFLCSRVDLVPVSGGILYRPIQEETC
jgi:hypothetical protein